MRFLVFTDEYRKNLPDWNAGTIYQVEPRLADAEGPHKGKWLAPARVVHRDYEEYWAEKLDGLEVISEDPADLFLPPPE